MENDVRVIKTVECDSLSHLSRLTYEYGMRSPSELVMRIAANSGNGMFSDDWVSVAEVINVLRSPLHQDAISSMAFRPLYAGRSINCQSFLMAVLRHEEVITTHPTKKRGYQVTAVSAFEERVRDLAQQATDSTKGADPTPEALAATASEVPTESAPEPAVGDASENAIGKTSRKGPGRAGKQASHAGPPQAD